MGNHAGDLIRKTHAENAEALVSRGLGEWIGRGDKRYVRLSESAPTLQTAQGWRGGSNTTQRIRTDAGIIVGAPKSGLEHKPLHEMQQNGTAARDFAAGGGSVPSPFGRIYTPRELATLWQLSENSIRRLFQDEVDVFTLGDSNPGQSRALC